MVDYLSRIVVRYVSYSSNPDWISGLYKNMVETYLLMIDITCSEQEEEIELTVNNLMETSYKCFDMACPITYSGKKSHPL